MKILSGKVNIDPVVRCQMGCGPHRNLLLDTDIIEANYLILFEDTLVLIVSFDLLYIGEKLTEYIFYHIKLLIPQIKKKIPLNT